MKPVTVRILIPLLVGLALPRFAAGEPPFAERMQRDRPPAERIEHLQRMRDVIGTMRAFLELVDQVHATTSDREKAAILQIHRLEEIHRKRGTQDGFIRMLEQLLAKTANPTLRNVIHIKLSETLERTGRSERAIEVLRRALEENLEAPATP